MLFQILGKTEVYLISKISQQDSDYIRKLFNGIVISLWVHFLKYDWFSGLTLFGFRCSATGSGLALGESRKNRQLFT